MLHALANWFVKVTGFIPQLFIFRLKVHYEDKSVQNRYIKGGAIIASNHHTLIDFAVLLFTFWTRTLRCLMAEVLYKKNFLMTGLIKALGGIKVNRDVHDFTFLGKSSDILRKGGVIEIYPEARLAGKDEEKPLPFKPSVIYLALSTGAPIIPFYTNGKYFSRERTRVIIGKPVFVREWYDDALDEKTNIDNMCKKLREYVIELGKELERQKAEEKKKK